MRKTVEVKIQNDAGAPIPVMLKRNKDGSFSGVHKTHAFTIRRYLAAWTVECRSAGNWRCGYPTRK
jgi:hypothetical protein